MRRSSHRAKNSLDASYETAICCAVDIVGPCPYFLLSSTTRTASPTVRTRSTSSSPSSMSNALSTSSTTSTRRAEFTLRSSRMRVSRDIRARASWFLANGLMMATTVLNISSLVICALESAPLAEDDASVHVAESEAGLGDDVQPLGLDGPSHDAFGEREQPLVQVLAVGRSVEEAAVELQHRGHALQPPRRAEPMSDEGFGGVDARELRGPALQGGRP